MSLKIKVAIGILALCGLFAYIYLVNKWNRERIPPASVHSNTATYASAKKEVELSYLKNKDSILETVKYPILIYRYSQDYCSSCVVEDLSELNILQNVK